MSIPKQIPHFTPMKTRAILAVVLQVLLACPALAVDRTWIAGTSSTSFNSTTNYTGSGAFSADDLYFDMPVLPLNISSPSNVSSLYILQGATGFYVGGELLVYKEKIGVAANTTATIASKLYTYNYGDSRPVYFDVGAGGKLTTGLHNLGRRELIKTGEGILEFLEGFDTSSPTAINNTVVVRIMEGTVLIGENALLQRTDTPLKVLPVLVGTEDTTGRLMGSGTINGIVQTFGASQSIIETSGDGSFFLSTVNAEAGATLRFRLGDVIVGDGEFTGQNLVFEFTGGEVGVVYTLLEFPSLTIDLDSLQIGSSGYELDPNFGVNGWLIDGNLLQVRFLEVIPEPNSALLFLTAAGFVLGCRLRRRPHV